MILVWGLRSPMWSKQVPATIQRAKKTPASQISIHSDLSMLSSLML